MIFVFYIDVKSDDDLMIVIWCRSKYKKEKKNSNGRLLAHSTKSCTILIHQQHSSFQLPPRLYMNYFTCQTGELITLIFHPSLPTLALSEVLKTQFLRGLNDKKNWSDYRTANTFFGWRTKKLFFYDRWTNIVEFYFETRARRISCFESGEPLNNCVWF